MPGDAIRQQPGRRQRQQHQTQGNQHRVVANPRGIDQQIILGDSQRQIQGFPILNRQGFHCASPLLPGAVQGEAGRIQPRRPALGIAQIAIQAVQHRLVQFKQRRQPELIRAFQSQQLLRFGIGQHLALFIEQRQFGAGQKPAGGQHGRDLAQGKISADHRCPGGGAARDGGAHFTGGEKQVGVGLHPLRPIPRHPVPGPAAGFKTVIGPEIAAQQIQRRVVKQESPDGCACGVALDTLRQVASRLRGIERRPQGRIGRQWPQQEKIAVVVANKQRGYMIRLLQDFP